MIDAEELKRWLGEKDETPRREFKLKYVLAGPGNNKHKDELAKDVVSLANTAGRNREDYAHLVIGAGDKLKPDGSRDRDDVRAHAYSRKSILDTVNARCHPSLPDLSYTEIEVDGNYYGVVEIPPSPFMHELSRDLDATSGSWRKGNVPIRRGDEVAPANFQEMTLLMQEKEWGKPAASPLEQLEEYLTDPTMAAKARKLVIDEAKKLYAVLNNPEFLKKDEDHRYVAIIERMTEYEELVRPFLDLFVAGCHGGGEWLGPVWAEALTILANPVDRPGGAEALVRLRRYPALLLLYAGGVAAVAGNNYGNLKSLLRQTQVRSYGPNKAPSFGLSPGRVLSSYDEEHLQEKQQHKMPFNFHVVNTLRDPLERYVHSSDQYMENFVRFEYLYALVSEAQDNGLIAGTFTWESEQMKGLERYPRTNVWIVQDTEEELDRLGADWPPFKSGLFDGTIADFRAFKKEVDVSVAEAARRFLFGR